MYTIQLSKCFPRSIILNFNDTYIHKILVHSPILFNEENIANLSCENGEASLAKIKRFLVNSNNNWQNDQERLIKYLELNYDADVKFRNSNVFNDFFLHFHFCELSLPNNWKYRGMIHLISQKFPTSTFVNNNETDVVYEKILVKVIKLEEYYSLLSQKAQLK